jgi:hypothetical protein
MKEDCDIASVRIDMVENGYLLTIFQNSNNVTKTYIARNF